MSHNALANLLLSQGDGAGARSHLAESLQIRRVLGDRRNMPPCLEGLARSPRQTSSGWTKRAVCLLGASEALREEIGSPIAPNERADYDRETAEVRAALGDAAFSAAWAQGRAMTLEQAIDCALDLSDTSSTSAHENRWSDTGSAR